MFGRSAAGRMAAALSVFTLGVVCAWWSVAQLTTPPTAPEVSAASLIAQADGVQEQGRPETLRKAAEAYQAALLLARSAGDSQAELVSLYRLGQVFLELRQAEEARWALQSALDSARKLGSRRYEALALWALGRLDGAQSPRARELLEEAIQATEGAIERPIGFGRELDVLRPIYEDYLEALFTVGSPGLERAFLVSERAHAQALLRFLTAIEIDIPWPKPRSLHEVQELLDSETVMLEYFLGEKRSYVWAITATAARWVELPPRAEVEAAAKRAHILLADGARRSADGAGLAALLRLSDLILGPVADQLHHRRLLIVADGAQYLIPFGALPLPASAPLAAHERRKGGYEPLLVNSEIVYLPSASVLLELRRVAARRAPPKREIAIVADPVYSAQDPRVPRPDLGGALQATGPASPHTLEPASLPRLRYAAQEAQAIAALATQPSLMTGFAASREAVVSRGLAGFRVVHFATHAVADLDQPQLSGLALSTVGPRGERLDGWLRPSDLSKLDLNADLVVLSSCESGIGRDNPDEGFASLARGFFFAGAQSVIVSLWEVEDSSTAELMALFYRGLFQEGLPPAAALQKAQLAIWSNPRWASPYFWAGFVLEGDWDWRMTRPRASPQTP